MNVAFYPHERGQYNYDNVNVDGNGKLLNPGNRWGGIMRPITTSDFETNNVEFIEFWLMDPFVEDKNNTGGDLYFNLGDVSEDVLADGRKSFESGMPDGSTTPLLDQTSWGRVPSTTQYTNSFVSIANQDIGLDGLNDADESTFFATYLSGLKAVVTNAEAIANAEADPSSDDYHYFRGGDYDTDDLDILQRYKKYNGVDGNTRGGSESYPTVAKSGPDNEDINSDNTLSTTERYYQYHISMRPKDLVVGENFIVDKIEVAHPKDASRPNVTWYQFKIPISDYQKVVGDIDDFKSIRFMRMFMKDFSDSVIMRFATLELVRGEWRKYAYSLQQAAEDIADQNVESNFDVSAVNIEENSEKTPVNYILPVGLSRAIDPSNTQLRELNEQSMVLKVTNLADGDAKAAYKTVNLDLRQYKKLKMDMHAESLKDQSVLRNKEAAVFLRLGSDYRNNYYEYEIKAKVTDAGTYDDNKEVDKLRVWPEDNRFVISLETLQKAKLARNEAMRKPGSTITLETVFPYSDGENTVYICGNPNLSNVKTIMIGIRNPKGDPYNSLLSGKPISGEFWVNELRLTDFNDKGGWAATGRMQTKLADLGTLNVSGFTSTPGWGSIEKSVNERDKVETVQYDISSSLELGKLFPENAGVQIPMYASYSEAIITPEYDPTDPDILYKDKLKGLSAHEKDSVENIAVDYTRRRSLNFSNVRIAPKNNAKPSILSISNWSASYGFNDIYSHNVNTKYRVDKTYRGALNYNYAVKAPNVQPFKKVKALNSKYLRLIKDFNFYYMPSSFSFRTEMLRNYAESQVRNISYPDLVFDPTVNKDFTWTRQYDLKFDLSRSLRFDFSADNIASIDEIEGSMKTDYERKKDKIIRGIKNMGRTTNYTHQFNINYNVPINKLPGFDWTSLNARYHGDYGWDAAAVGSEEVGNTIKNSNSIQLVSNLNFRTVFDKVGYFKKLHQPANKNKNKKPETIKVNFEQSLPRLRKNTQKSINHNLGTTELSVTAKNAEGGNVPINFTVSGPNRVRVSSPDSIDLENVTIYVEGTKPKPQNPLIILMEGGVKTLIGLKDVSISVTQEGGTYMPGYNQKTNLFGLDKTFTSPGLAFVAGVQNRNFDSVAYTNRWTTRTTTYLLDPTTYKNATNINIRGTYEPFQGFKVELLANRTYSEVLNRYYNTDNGRYDKSSDMLSGSYSISVWTIGSSFNDLNSKTYASKVFNQFSKNRSIISERLATRRGNWDKDYAASGKVLNADTLGGYNGYSFSSQNVILPAFVAAYLNQDANSVDLDMLDNLGVINKNSLKLIRPNWRVTFDGFSKIPFIEQYFKAFSVTHSYSSTFSIGSFETNLDYETGEIHKDLINDFLPKYDASVVSINEQYSPLLGVELGWKNNLTNRFEYKRSRSVALSLTNSQVMEILSNEYVIGGSYKFEQLQLIINGKEFKSDLDLRLDISFRNDKTVLRRLIEDINVPTDGKKNIKYSFSAEYQLSDKFNLRVFYDRTVTNPFVSKSTTYKTANTEIGFSVKFTLI
jgi:cell surface protein SprA